MNYQRLLDIHSLQNIMKRAVQIGLVSCLLTLIVCFIQIITPVSSLERWSLSQAVSQPTTNQGATRSESTANETRELTEVTEDPEVVSLNHFINQVVTNTTVDLMEPYLCSDCGVRELVMYSDLF